MDLAPIVLFVYNRLWHTRQTIEALKKNTLAADSHLFIFADGNKPSEPEKPVIEVREYLRTINGFSNVTIIEQERNLGLANSVISGVTEIVNRYGMCIVLEDDLITSPYFLQFMNDALIFYQGEEKVFSIGGYNYPDTIMKIPSSYKDCVYFTPRSCSWGWATWKDKWVKGEWKMDYFTAFKENKTQQKAFCLGGDDLFDMLSAQFEGKIDSWSIRWDYSHFLRGAVCVYPVFSLVNNIGHDGSGIHCGKDDSNRLGVNLDMALEQYPLVHFSKINSEVMNQIQKIHHRGFITRLKYKFKELIVNYGKI
jgi:hypothetical protein